MPSESVCWACLCLNYTAAQYVEIYKALFATELLLAERDDFAPFAVGDFVLSALPDKPNEPVLDTVFLCRILKDQLRQFGGLTEAVLDCVNSGPADGMGRSEIAKFVASNGFTYSGKEKNFYPAVSMALSRLSKKKISANKINGAVKFAPLK